MFICFNLQLRKMPYESGRKPEVAWNEVQCESDMHIVDFLQRKLFFFHDVHWFINWVFLVGFFK
jgi:hypothetical protein